MPETVIRGALAVLGDGSHAADVGITGGRIDAIAGAGELTGGVVVDATGLVLLPGAVDPHVHVHTRFGPWLTTDDFWTATFPAALGGTTTIINFAIPLPGESTLMALDRCLGEARDACAVDYTMHACVTGETLDRSLGELEAVAAAGVGSVKVFSTYMDTVGLSLDEIGRVLARCADVGLLVLVHAEADDLITAGIATEVAAGHLQAAGHVSSRPASAEAEAIDAIARMAAGNSARVYFVHVSSAEGVRRVRDAKARGWMVNGETCIQYLFLDQSVYDRDDGELWICSPPIRSLADQESLWAAIHDGVLDVVSTDHNCFSREQKLRFRGDFRRVPNGLPGVELRLPLLIGAALDERLSWEEVARLSAEAPARLFGVWPRKGLIAEGADADLVLIDPSGETDLSTSHMTTDYSPFVDFKPRGRIAQTWLRGRPIVQDGEFRGDRGDGAWLVPARGATREAA